MRLVLANGAYSSIALAPKYEKMIEQPTLDLFSEPSPVTTSDTLTGSTFVCGSTGMCFKVTRQNGDVCVVVGPSGKKREVPKSFVEERLK